MLWRHRFAHIMYAFTLDCHPGAVQKIPQFRALRKVNHDIDHFVGSGRSLAVGLRSPVGLQAPLFRPCRSLRLQGLFATPAISVQKNSKTDLRCGRYNN